MRIRLLMEGKIGANEIDFYYLITLRGGPSGIPEW